MLFPYSPSHPLNPEPSLPSSSHPLLSAPSLHFTIFTLDLAEPHQLTQFRRYPVPHRHHFLHPSSLFFQLFWSPSCPINALALISLSLHPSTTLFFLTPPGTSPVFHSPSFTFKNLHPLPTTNPLPFSEPRRSHPPPVLVLQLISLCTSSHPCHVWLLITLSPLLPTITPALPLLAAHFQL